MNVSNTKHTEISNGGNNVEMTNVFINCHHFQYMPVSYNKPYFRHVYGVQMPQFFLFPRILMALPTYYPIGQRIVGLGESVPSFYDVQVEHQKLNSAKISENLLKGTPSSTYNEIFKAMIYTNGKSNMFVYPTGAIIYEGVRDRNEFKGTQSEALETAKQFVQEKGGGLPNDAYVAEIIPQLETTATPSQRVTAYLVIFKHQIEGITIDGVSGDSIRLLVDNNGVSYMFRMWRNIVSKKLKMGKPLVDSQSAINAAIKYYATFIKTTASPVFERLELVYWSKSYKEFQDSLPLAWKVTLSGRDIYIDAETGEILSSVKI